MHDRLERLKAVRTIIKNNHIDSQDKLLQLLADEGFIVTQATLSRDLKYLRVGKVWDAQVAGYYYTIPSDEERRESERHYIQDFLRGYVSIDWNQSMVVVRTFSGHSDSVALAIDNMGIEEVLGTISGRDNVVFVALREGVSGEDFMAAMRRKVPELEED